MTSSPVCGASTCFEAVQILGWNGTGFANLLSGSTVEIPAPVISLPDPQGDGIFDLEIAGGGYGSAGAGPQRGLATVWTYNPATGLWQDPQERLESSNYRIHVLQDGDQAARETQFAQALVNYGRVVDDASLIDKARRSPEMNGLDLAKVVTTAKSYEWSETDKTPFALKSIGRSSNNDRPWRVVVYDYGVKFNILRRLVSYGCQLTVVSASMPAEDILKMEPDGIFLSNGPGDPAAVKYAIENIKKLVGKKPIFGICLGHQLTALALGVRSAS